MRLRYVPLIAMLALAAVTAHAEAPGAAKGISIPAPAGWQPPPTIYVCTADYGAGLKYKGGEWKPVTFDRGFPSFEVRQSSAAHLRNAYELVRVTDSSRTIVGASDPVDEQDVPYYIVIKPAYALDVSFIFYPKTGRFSMAEQLGFVNDQRDQTPAIFQGTCRKVGKDPWEAKRYKR